MLVSVISKLYMENVQLKLQSNTDLFETPVHEWRESRNCHFK